VAKTTVHLQRPPAPSEPTGAPPIARPSTVRLGVMVSVFAAIAAVVVNALTDVPTVAILIAVVVIGFTLSWHTTGQHDNAPPR
jgi:hypothetical protein